MQRSLESISYSSPASSSSSRLELLSSERSSVDAAEELSLDCCCLICRGGKEKGANHLTNHFKMVL